MGQQIWLEMKHKLQESPCCIVQSIGIHMIHPDHTGTRKITLKLFLINQSNK